MKMGLQNHSVDHAGGSDLVERQCPLCESIHGRGALPLDRPWLQSTFGAVLPALGHLIPGHLLVCSSAHYPNLLSAPAEVAEDLLELLDKTQQRLRDAFGLDCFAFEHGFVGKNTSEIGCSIDHIHLHILPLADTLLQQARQWVADFTPLNASAVSDRSRYLLARVGFDGKWLASPDGLQVTHRHFLKLLDQELGRTGRYDEVMGVSGELIRQTHDILGLDESEIHPVHVLTRIRGSFYERLTV